MDNIKSKLDLVLEWVTIVIFSSMTLLVSWQVFTRYILNNPSTTSEITAKYLFVWLVFLGAAYVFGKREHMNISFIKDKMNAKVQMILDVAIEVLIMIFTACVLVFGGYYLMSKGMAQVDATLQIPMGYVYAVIPLSGILTLFYNVCNIKDVLVTYKSIKEEK